MVAIPGSGGPRDLVENISKVDEVCSWFCSPDDNTQEDVPSKDSGVAADAIVTRDATQNKGNEDNTVEEEAAKRRKEEEEEQEEAKKKTKGDAGKKKKLTKTQLELMKYKEESKKLAEEAATAKVTGMSDPLQAPESEVGKEKEPKEPPFELPEVDETQLSHDSDDIENLTPPDEDTESYSCVVQMQELYRKVFRMLGDRLTRRPSEYVSPFKCKGQRPQIPMAKAIALRRRLQNDKSLSQLNLMLFGFDVMLNGEDVLSNFNDGCMVENPLVQYLVACLRHDDVVYRPEAVGYIVFISPDFWLCMRELSKVDKNDETFRRAVEILKDDFDNVDLNRTKLLNIHAGAESATLDCVLLQH
ncbi:hypothetical protein ACP70R_018870 [Stipagrostis hirtigluma subsp. patula]